jgi:hypothetical protein
MLRQNGLWLVGEEKHGWADCALHEGRWMNINKGEFVSFEGENGMYDDSPIHTRIIRIAVLPLVVLSPCSTRAGTPAEELYVDGSDINRHALQHAIGVLTFTLVGSYTDTSTPGTPVTNPALVDIPFIVTVTHIPIYRFTNQAFVSDGKLRLGEMVPVSGMDGGCYEKCTRSMSFPIVATRGEYQHIVYHPVQNLRTWIKLSASDQACANRSFCASSLYFTKRFINTRMSSEMPPVNPFFLKTPGGSISFLMPNQHFGRFPNTMNPRSGNGISLTLKMGLPRSKHSTRVLKKSIWLGGSNSTIMRSGSVFGLVNRIGVAKMALSAVQECILLSA